MEIPSSKKYERTNTPNINKNVVAPSNNIPSTNFAPPKVFNNTTSRSEQPIYKTPQITAPIVNKVNLSPIPINKVSQPPITNNAALPSKPFPQKSTSSGRPFWLIGILLIAVMGYIATFFVSRKPLVSQTTTPVSKPQISKPQLTKAKVTVPTKKTLNVLRAVIAKGLDLNEQPLDGSNSFYQTANELNTLTFYSNYEGAIAQKTNFSVKWVKDGQDIYQSKNFVAKADSGYYWTKVHYNFVPGKYEALFLVNGKKITKVKFSVISKPALSEGARNNNQANLSPRITEGVTSFNTNQPTLEETSKGLPNNSLANEAPKVNRTKRAPWYKSNSEEVVPRTVNNNQTVLVLRWMDAASQGDRTLIKLLLTQKIDVNIKDSLGRTALIIAAGEGHGDLVKMLLDNGADVNAKTDSGRTALMSAVIGGHDDTVKTLITRGASITVTDSNGNTAVTEAKKVKNAQILKLLQGINR